MTKRKPRKRAKLAAAVAYIRVSKDEAVQALGVEAQRAAIAEWAAREGVTVIAEHVESVTGGAPLHERPVLLAALAEVAAQRAQFLAVAKLDRFSRDAVTAVLAGQELTRANASLGIADGQGAGDSPTDKLVRGILLTVAEFERAMIGARIKAALAVKKAKGEMVGKPPYGFRTVDGPARLRRDGVQRPVRMLEPDPDEQRTITAARAMSESGVSLRAVIAQLAAEGMLNRVGKPFDVASMHAILTGEQRVVS